MSSPYSDDHHVPPPAPRKYVGTGISLGLFATLAAPVLAGVGPFPAEVIVAAPLLGLVVGLGLLLVPRLRGLALGIVIGAGVALLVLTVACFALVASYSRS